jgi:hypothetical protein
MTTGEAQNFAQNFALPALTNESMRAVTKRSQPKRIKYERLKTTAA